MCAKSGSGLINSVLLVKVLLKKILLVKVEEYNASLRRRKETHTRSLGSLGWGMTPA
jgi:hypothetical protein